MPTYPVKHKETGETKELSMTMIEYSQWRDENKDWDKDWSAGVAGVGEVGDWQSKLKKSHPRMERCIASCKKNARIKY